MLEIDPQRTAQKRDITQVEVVKVFFSGLKQFVTCNRHSRVTRQTIIKKTKTESPASNMVPLHALAHTLT